MKPTFTDGFAEAPITAESEWRMEKDRGVNQKHLLYPVIYDDEQNPYGPAASILVEIIGREGNTINLRMLDNTLYALGVSLVRAARIAIDVLEEEEGEAMVVQVTDLAFTGEVVTWEMF